MTAEEKDTKQVVKHKRTRKESRGLIRDIINGTILTREGFVKQLPFILFLSLLAIIYIANRYHEEKIVREISRLQHEIKKLKSEQISITSDLMLKSKQSEVIKLVQEQGLELQEPVEPPKKILTED